MRWILVCLLLLLLPLLVVIVVTVPVGIVCSSATGVIVHMLIVCLVVYHAGFVPIVVASWCGHGMRMWIVVAAGVAVAVGMSVVPIVLVLLWLLSTGAGKVGVPIRLLR